MQTNILDWLEATSARCPDAPAVGDDQTDCRNHKDCNDTFYSLLDL